MVPTGNPHYEMTPKPTTSTMLIVMMMALMIFSLRK
jgi:hypothetical protein